VQQAQFKLKDLSSGMTGSEKLGREKAGKTGVNLPTQTDNKAALIQQSILN